MHRPQQPPWPARVLLRLGDDDRFDDRSDGLGCGRRRRHHFGAGCRVRQLVFHRCLAPLQEEDQSDSTTRHANQGEGADGGDETSAALLGLVEPRAASGVRGGSPGRLHLSGRRRVPASTRRSATGRRRAFPAERLQGEHRAERHRAARLRTVRHRRRVHRLRRTGPDLPGVGSFGLSYQIATLLGQFGERAGLLPQSQQRQTNQHTWRQSRFAGPRVPPVRSVLEWPDGCSTPSGVPQGLDNQSGREILRQYCY